MKSKSISISIYTLVGWAEDGTDDFYDHLIEQIEEPFAMEISWRFVGQVSDDLIEIEVDYYVEEEEESNGTS